MNIGQYQILQKIGAGGMGVIYKAEHATLKQVVAIKALHASLSAKADIKERFLREATIHAKISHPNIVSIHNFFEADGNCYIVMEYVEGETLEAMIRRLGLIPPEQCISLFRQVLSGIQYAHDKGIVHRDLKPGNIMVSADGVVKIMDFGIAKIAGGANLTRVGVKVGTVWYMSPEQVTGQPASIATDIYSLGVTLFQMVTGRVPFYAESEFDVMKTIVETPPAAPRTFYPYVPEFLEKAILKALSKSSADRFQSAADFARALRPREDQPAAAGSVAGRWRSLAQEARTPHLLVGMALLLLFFVATAFLLDWSWTSAPKAPLPAPDRETRGAAVPPAPAVEPAIPRKSPPEARGAEAVRTLEPQMDSAREATSGSVAADARREQIALYLRKGKRYHEDGEFDRAREMYRKVLKLDGDNRAARTGIAYTFMAQKALRER